MAPVLDIKAQVKGIVNRNTTITDNGCWEWQGYCNRNGYALASFGSRSNNTRHTASVHRKTFEVYKGEIPAGLQVDHTCRNRACVNPGHLEAVTAKENVNRTKPFRTPESYAAKSRVNQTHCKYGHSLDYVAPITGHRGCKICRSNNMRRHYLKNKGTK